MLKNLDLMYDVIYINRFNNTSTALRQIIIRFMSSLTYTYIYILLPSEIIPVVVCSIPRRNLIIQLLLLMLRINGRCCSNMR